MKNQMLTASLIVIISCQPEGKVIENPIGKRPCSEGEEEIWNWSGTDETEDWITVQFVDIGIEQENEVWELKLQEEEVHFMAIWNTELKIPENLGLCKKIKFTGDWELWVNDPCSSAELNIGLNYSSGDHEVIGRGIYLEQEIPIEEELCESKEEFHSSLSDGGAITGTLLEGMTGQKVFPVIQVHLEGEIEETAGFDIRGFRVWLEK